MYDSIISYEGTVEVPPFRSTYVEVPKCNSRYKLFERLFARVYACDPSSILGRDALVEDGDDLGHVSLWYYRGP
jgi:hypothetical protein